MSERYIFTSRAQAVRAYQAFQQAAGLPRKTPGLRHIGGGRHAVVRDVYDPDAKSNPGWDADETGKVMKHPNRDEWALVAHTKARAHEGKRRTIDGQQVTLPTARVKVDDSEWTSATEVRERGKL